MKWCRFQAGQGELRPRRGRDGHRGRRQSVRGVHLDRDPASTRPGEAPAARDPPGSLRRGPQLSRPSRRHGEAARGAAPLPGPARTEASLAARAHRNGGEHRRAEGLFRRGPARGAARGRHRQEGAERLRDEALDCVLGYSIGNDVSQREWQRTDRTLFRAKNCDTFKPFGPWIVTGLDPGQVPHHRPSQRNGLGGLLLGRPDLGYGDLALTR